MTLGEQVQELLDFLNNAKRDADAADNGNKSAGIRLRKGMMNLSRQALVIRLNAYNAAYGKAPKSKGGVKDAGKN